MEVGRSQARLLSSDAEAPTHPRVTGSSHCLAYFHCFQVASEFFQPMATSTGPHLSTHLSLWLPVWQNRLNFEEKLTAKGFYEICTTI